MQYKTPASALPSDLFGEPVAYRAGGKRRQVNPRWTPRAGNFGAASQEELASQCRSILIGRMDRLFLCLPVLEREHGVSKSAGLAFIQALQLLFFPEEFAEGPEAGMIAGLIPREGRMERCGAVRFAAFAEQLLAGGD